MSRLMVGCAKECHQVRRVVVRCGDLPTFNGACCCYCCGLVMEHGVMGTLVRRKSRVRFSAWIITRTSCARSTAGAADRFAKDLLFPCRSYFQGMMVFLVLPPRKMIVSKCARERVKRKRATKR